MKTVTLCHKPGRCCPTVTVDKEVVIKDDYDNTVRMTKEQFEVLKDKIKNNEL